MKHDDLFNILPASALYRRLLEKRENYAKYDLSNFLTVRREVMSVEITDVGETTPVLLEPKWPRVKEGLKHCIILRETNELCREALILIVKVLSSNGSYTKPQEFVNDSAWIKRHVVSVLFHILHSTESESLSPALSELSSAKTTQTQLVRLLADRTYARNMLSLFEEIIFSDYGVRTPYILLKSHRKRIMDAICTLRWSTISVIEKDGNSQDAFSELCNKIFLKKTAKELKEALFPVPVSHAFQCMMERFYKERLSFSQRVFFTHRIMAYVKEWTAAMEAGDQTKADEVVKNLESFKYLENALNARKRSNDLLPVRQ